MKSKQTIVYIMRPFDIGGQIDIPYKKVGITGAGNATLDSRLQQISNTKSPIKAQCIAAWEHENARDVENAIHLLLEDTRVEGEWFLDKDDSLVERMHPIMDLIGAKEVEITPTDDLYSKEILEKEGASRKKADHELLGEIAGMLKHPMRSSSRVSGPTFFSDKKKLTFYANARKSGEHSLHIGRSKQIYSKLKSFLEENGIDCSQGKRGSLKIFGITSKRIAQVINLIESEFVV